jgi:hypothetical protein
MTVVAPWKTLIGPVGSVLTGASLTAAMLMPTESVSVFAPPEPLLPWSLVVTVSVAEPLWFAAGL